MEKKGSIQIVVTALIVIVLCLVALLIWYPFEKEPTYDAVYMKSGDIYFGTLSTFPSWKLTNVWYLDRTQDGIVTVQDFSKVVWQPQGAMRIQPEAVLWVAPLSSESPVINIMKGEGTPLPAQNVQETTPVPTQE
jgi:hypothetical protein